MNRVPFTVYDFFAYLSSGSVLVATFDYLFGYRWLLQDQLSAVLIVFLVFASYVAGHVVAHFSSFLLERLLVHKGLEQPASTLMGDSPRAAVLGKFFRAYYKALPTQTRQRVEQRAASRGFSGTGEALFLHALSVVTKDERAQQRLDEFRNLYGFARNMTFALLLAAALLAVGTGFYSQPPTYSWALLAAGVGLTMLYRYLKFFHQYSFQLFVTYAELEAPRPLKQRAAGAS